MSSDEILLEAEEKMIKTEQVIVNEFAGVRTGKASASLIENVLVEVYGSQMRLRELTGIQAIEKAIQKANLGLSPVVQGKIIRVSFPELSAERRQEFVKITHRMAEDARVAVRHVRRDAMELLKKAVKAHETSEEDQEKTEKEIQKLTDQYIAKIDAHLAHKEKEILTV